MSRPNFYGTSLSTSSYAQTHSPVQQEANKLIFSPVSVLTVVEDQQ
jgi:hypothetical protein